LPGDVNSLACKQRRNMRDSSWSWILLQAQFFNIKEACLRKVLKNGM